MAQKIMPVTIKLKQHVTKACIRCLRFFFFANSLASASSSRIASPMSLVPPVKSSISSLAVLYRSLCCFDVSFWSTSAKSSGTPSSTV